MRKGTSGFTIVELLIVIVVIAILATISVVAFNGVQVRARDTQRQHDIAQLTKALELYYIDNGQYPPSSCAANCSINSSWSTTADGSWPNLVNSLKPYMGNVPSDPISKPNSNVQSPGNYNYAYFSSNTYCGAAATKQTYILLYQLEGSPQTNTLIGDCSTTPLGPYVNASNYRVHK